MARFLEKQEGIYRDKPVLVYKAQVDRRVYVRRLRWAIVTVLASGGVFFMLSLPPIRAQLDAFTAMPGAARAALWIGGYAAALLLLIVGGARAVTNAVLVARRRTEQIRFYDVGFAWQMKDDPPAKYGWSAVKTIREKPRGWYWRGKPVLQWGEISFKMRDGETYRVRGAHGDLRAFLGQVRPYYADEMGTRMGQRLRMEKSFRVHPQITVAPAGLVVGEQRIAWKHLKVEETSRELVIGRVDADGAMQQVKTFPAHQVDNLAGFMELAETTIENFQRPNPYARR